MPKRPPPICRKYCLEPPASGLGLTVRPSKTSGVDLHRCSAAEDRSGARGSLTTQQALARGTGALGASSRLGWSPSSPAGCRETSPKLVFRVGLSDFASNPCFRKLQSSAIFEAAHYVPVVGSGLIHRRLQFPSTDRSACLSRCSAGLGFSSPGLICLVGIRLGHSGSSDRHKARSLRPSLSGRRKIQPPDLVRLIGIRVGLPGLSIGACRSAMYGSTRLLVAPPFFSRCPVARIGPACRGFYSAQLLSWVTDPNLSISWPAPLTQLPRVGVAGLGANSMVWLLSCRWSNLLPGRLVSAEDRRTLGADQRMPGSVLFFDPGLRFIFAFGCHPDL
ncbi:hypothetical protein U1Q18_020886 [Sarracenia purpurea var. burkii]